MIEALLQAVRDQLRSSLAGSMPGGSTKAKFYVDICPGDVFPVRAGDWFVAVDEEAVHTPTPSDRNALKEEFSISTTIFRKTGAHVSDNASSIYLESLVGLSALERLIVAAIHGNHTVRAAANVAAGNLPGASVGDQFQSPLYYTGRGRAERIADPASRSDTPPTYIRRKLTFRGGLRVQSLAVMK